MGDGRGELSGLGETGAEETRDLLDEGVGGDERIVLAGKLLDELLVLVELLQVVRGHGVDAVVLSTVNVVLVTEDADGLQKSVHVSKDWKLGGLTMLGRGTVGSLMVPEKRLSRWGS